MCSGNPYSKRFHASKHGANAGAINRLKIVLNKPISTFFFTLREGNEILPYTVKSMLKKSL